MTRDASGTGKVRAMRESVRAWVEVIAARLHARPCLYTFLPVVPLVVIVATYTTLRAVYEPRWRAYRDYGIERGEHQESLRSESGYDGTVLVILSSREAELLSGLPALTVNRAYVCTWPGASFRNMAAAYENLAGKLKRMAPPEDLRKSHAQSVDRALAQAKILADAARNADANDKVHIDDSRFITLCMRWQDIEADEAESRRERPDLRVLQPARSLASFAYVACASDPEPITTGSAPLWRALVSGNPVKNTAIVILTVFLVLTGLRLSFSPRTVFWAPAFCTWSAWIPCLIGLLTLVSYAIHEFRHCHCDLSSFDDVATESCEYRATLWLGFLNAGMLQLLGAILFLAGRPRRTE